jgi:hypothetical protein
MLRAILFALLAALALSQDLANARRRANVRPGTIDKGMDLWLDASKINPVQPQEVGSTGSVQLWRDASMQGRQASNVFTLAEQPIYMRNSAAGLPAVKFGNNNVLRSLNLQSNYLFSDDSGITMYFMVRSNHVNPNPLNQKKNFLIDFGNYTTRGFGVYYSRGFVGVWTGTGTGGKDSGAIPTGVDCNAWVAVTVEIKFKKDNIGGSQTIWINGNRIYSAEINTESITEEQMFASSTAMATKGPVTIGAKSSQNLRFESFFIGELAELISYSRVLEYTSRLSVEDYLMSKYMIDTEERFTSACVPMSTLTLLTESYKVYMNGRLIQSGAAGVTPVDVDLPRRPRQGDVIAVEASTALNFRGLKAQLTSRLSKSTAGPVVTAVTDSTWVCSGEPRMPNSTTWAGLDYHDSDYLFRSGTESGHNRPSSPDGVLDLDAQWIWASTTPDVSAAGGVASAAKADLASTAYCRLTIGTFIDRIKPSEGYTNEDTTVTVMGRGFGDGVTASPMASDDVEPVVMIGARRCASVRRLSPRKIQCKVMNYPSVTEQKEDDVVVQAGAAGATSPGGWNWLCGCSTKQA